MECVIGTGNEQSGVGEIQQEIITDIIGDSETVLAVYQVQDADSSNPNEEPAADLSALATVAEIVPTLQEVEAKGDTDIEIPEICPALQKDANVEEGTLDTTIEGEDEIVNLETSNTTPGEYFVTTSYEEMITIIHDYFERTSSRFVVQKRTKDFGTAGSNYNLNKHRIQWEDTKNPNLAYEYSFLPFDGVPHITVGHYVMHCQFGNDSSASQKEKRRLLRQKDEMPKQRRNLKHPTKKCGCPAKIYVKQVVKFPQFKITKKTERRKRTGAAKLKEQYNIDRSLVQTEVYYMGRMPVVEEHLFHELMQGREFSKESVHKDLIIKAQELYFKKISLSEITSHLETYVLDEMFYKQKPPERKRRKYFPSRKDLRNFIGRIRQIERFTKEEKERIDEMVVNIRGEQKSFNVSFETESESKLIDATLQLDSSDEEYYNSEEKPANVSTTENSQKKRITERQEIQTFLFCYQTPEQQRLLKRYGSIAFLVEIHHNSSVKRALTYKMFVLLVQTNVDYQAVGCFIYSKQRKDGLRDGLTKLKGWNKWWLPKYFLLDCTEEISVAYDQVFPNVPSFLNIHSCEKSWYEFLLTPSNELQDVDDVIMGFLKNMAYSFSESSLSIAASLLEESSIWHTSVKLRTWFQAEWLPTAKKWVAGYRPEDLFVFEHIEYDLQSCIKIYEDLLSDSTKQNVGFIGLLDSLHRVVSKEEYAKYIQRNICQYSTGKQFKVDESISESLAGVPSFILSILYPKALEASKCNLAIAEGNQLGLFVVSTLATKQINEVVEIGLQKGDTITLENCLINSINFSSNLQLQNNNTTNPGLLPSQPGASVEPVQQQIQPLLSSCSTENDVEEYTVSFGDMSSYPFCTCTYWQQYKIPCVHMLTIFQSIPGWNYDMLSPVYRMNNVFYVDQSCISLHRRDVRLFTEKSCQTLKTVPTMIEAQTQKNNINHSIFFPMNSLKVSDSLYTKVTDLLFHLNKTAFLFKDVLIYKKLRSQLTDLVRATHQKLSKRQLEQQLDGKNSSSKIILPKSFSEKEAILMEPVEKNLKRPVKVKVALNQPAAPTGIEIVQVDEVSKLLKAIVESNEAFVRTIDTANEIKNGTLESNSPTTQTETLKETVETNPPLNQINVGVTNVKTSIIKDITPTLPTEKLTFLEPITQPGTKRDASHLVPDPSVNDKIKVSILEYLPLLKQKCVLPEDFDREQKISLEMLASKLNVTLEQARTMTENVVHGNTPEVTHNITDNPNPDTGSCTDVNSLEK